MGGSKKGGSGGGSTPQTSPYEEMMAKISRDLWQSTKPVRKDLLGQMGDFVGGGYDPTTLPGYQPLYGVARSGIEDQFGVAKEQIMSNMPKGGALDAALNALDTTRAQQVGTLPASISGGIIQDLMNKAYGTSFGAPTQAIQGFGGANAGWTSRANAATAADLQNSMADRQMMSNIGQGIGQMMKLAK